MSGDRPRAVLLDVNETLTDLTALGPRFGEVGLDPGRVPTWFAQTLRDGFALAALGRSAPFADIAGAVLAGMLDPADPGGASGAVDTVLAGFGELPLHPDVEPGLRALAAAGLRVGTLTNGSAQVTRALLDHHGLTGLVDPVLSVEDAGAWKPCPPAYRYAARVLRLPPSAVLLAAVHPWDVDGAIRSGMSGALLARTPTPVPPYLAAPTLTATGLDDLARILAS